LLAAGAAGSIYSETLYPRFHFGWSDLASLADGRFHYIHSPAPEFYDWTADPAEKKDLARDLPAPFREMRVALVGMNRPLNEPGVSDPETVKKLASLGYISATSADAGNKDLPNPRDRIGALARLKEASRLSSRGKYDEAVAVLQQLVRESPRMLDALEALARVLREAGRPAEAFDALSEADSLEPGAPQILLGLADLALEKGDLAKARAFGRAAAAGGAAGASQILAEAALAGKDFEEARRQARLALAVGGPSRAGFLLLASIEKDAGNLPAAWSALEHVQQGAQGAEKPLKDYQFLRGDVLARMGREAEAEAAFREEMRLFPENPRGWTGLALLCASQRKPGEADRVLRDMIVKSSRPASYFAAAQAYEVLGDRGAALRLRKRAESLFPGVREREAR
jgi:predicted Zn-dependent protease